MTEREPVVELHHVHKRYGPVVALNGVDIAIGRGEVVAWWGPNGAGKTTSMKLMLGLGRPTAGAVRVFGGDPAGVDARSRCGAMLQDSGLPELLTVTELVRLFRSYYPSPLPAAQVIELAGLQECAGTRFGQLSGGQRQRLYCGLAICGDPDLLVLDEPTVGLDVEGRRLFLGVIGDWAQSGKTIVLTTHHLEEAGLLASRVVVLDRGSVLADESPEALRARVPGKRIRLRLGAPLPTDALAFLPISAVERHSDQLHPNAGGVAVNLVALPLYFAAGVFRPISQLPPFIQHVAPYLPSYRYAQLAWTAVGANNTAPLRQNLIYLAGWTAAFIFIAVRAYRREESRRLA
jgi:ABC-2 type transport system ATP-binding protein